MNILVPKVEGRSLVVVGNKIDLVQEKDLEGLRKTVSELIAPHDLVMTSAITGEGLDTLRNRMSMVQGRSWIVMVDLPLVDSSYSILSRIRSIADVVSRTTDDVVKAEIRCKPIDAEKIVGWLSSVSASNINSHGEAPMEGLKMKEPPAEAKGPPSSEEVH